MSNCKKECPKKCKDCERPKYVSKYEIKDNLFGANIKTFAIKIQGNQFTKVSIFAQISAVTLERVILRVKFEKESYHVAFNPFNDYAPSTEKLFETYLKDAKEFLNI